MAGRRSSAPLPALVAVLLVLAAAAPRPSAARAQPTEAEVRRLVERFIAALAARDGEVLVSLFADTPSRVCNDLDLLVFSALTKTENTSGIAFERMAESRAILAGGPAVVLLSGGRLAVTFGLDWTFRLQDEDEARELHLIVEWRLERRGSEWKVVDHRSREIGGGAGC